MLGGYNAYFEMAALLFLTAMTLRFFVSPKFSSQANRYFGIFLIAVGIDIALDIFSCITLEFINEWPLWITVAGNTLFYCFQAVIPALMLTYIQLKAGHPCLRDKKQLWLLVPGLVLLLAQFVNLIRPGLVFSIDTQPDRTRVFSNGGPMNAGLYLEAAFYLIMTVVQTVRYRENMTDSERHCVYTFVLVVIAALLVQIPTGSILLTGSSMVLALFIMMFTLQNPQAMVDKACGTFNYNALMAFIENAIAENKPQYIVSIEVEGIGTIDRSLGLVAGNQYMTEICRFFRNIVPGAWVFRIIGARFLIAAPTREAMWVIASSVEERFREPWHIGHSSSNLSATVLYLQMPGGFTSTGEFISFVDEATARMGRDGQRHRLENGHSILEEVRRRQAVEEAIRDVLREGTGFSLNYQPVYSAGEQRMYSAEALLRMNHPELGRVAPDEFIRVAEHCGLAPQIDAWVIRSACRFLQEHEELEHLDINLSGAEFYHDSTGYICGILNEFDVAPSRICFEITETASAQHPETVRSFMETMLKKGYSFALDDFGMGYANIAQVLHMPFRTVKLDRSLICEDSESARTLLGSLLGMFAGIGKQTVTEGVENPEQLHFVTRRGATFIQGYYFSRPLPEKEFVELLQKQAYNNEES
ncbi:MAG: hypothetical protein CW338_04415 [Clostridiales bacterium]|nr:hypothetical protein [Clostridiales bacterium]